ncbi:histone H3.3 [Iris pallida]|uniref:Histone H3.3 n=1 Tax=Iris pallida TaxID=29817 RepID=A0AAX6G006_IRIPA|nr:histone H3.3 [Iris pallida]
MGLIRRIFLFSNRWFEYDPKGIIDSNGWFVLCVMCCNM